VVEKNSSGKTKDTAVAIPRIAVEEKDSFGNTKDSCSNTKDSCVRKDSCGRKGQLWQKRTAVAEKDI
jgi:hypothetical protein